MGLLYKMKLIPPPFGERRDDTRRSWTPTSTRATLRVRLGSRRKARGRGGDGEARVKEPGLWIPWAAPFVLILVVPIPARAFELSGGVSLGVSRPVPFHASR